MRRKYLAILLLVLYGAAVGTIQETCGQSSNWNYIRSRTFTDTLGTKCLDEITYFDGLGRPVQTVQKGFTTGKNDLVTYQEYDSFGRKSNTWLPVSVSGNNGAFVSPATISSSTGISYPGEAKPYSHPVYEASPLNRVLEQYGPGATWQNNSRSVKTGYFTNISSNDTLNCVYYKVSETTGVTDSMVTVSMVGNYPTGSLLVSRITDEDGNASFEFKDHLGQVLLMRQIARNGNAKVLHDTYYIYDGFGNCTAVLPPLAADNLKSGSPWTNATSIFLRNYAYLYMYDSRGRCKAKRLPGCAWSYYIYDKADRLLFSQDGEQRSKSPQEWTFTLPDALGRVCLSGTCKNTYNALAAISPINMVVKLTRNNNTDAYKGYTLPAGITLSTPVILSVNYYDDYAFMGKNGIAGSTDTNFMYNPEQGFNTRYTTSAKTFLTGTLTGQLLSDGTVSATYLCSIMYYDYQGKVIQTKSSNHLAGGIEKEYIAYNFTGQPVKTKHIHSATNKATQTEIYTYTYDDSGRLGTVKHKLNTGGEVTLAANTFDEPGRLKTTSRNDVPTMKSTYAYNTRSWIISISSTLFSQTLYYNNTYGGSTPRYNGNLSAMSWSVNGENKTRGYRFTYDNLSRLTAANYLEGGGLNDHFNTTYSYDKHGNMLSLVRRGNTAASTYGNIDNLIMQYNGNQLKKTEDTGVNISLSTSMDFKNGSTASQEYFYDRNGSLTKDLNKGISIINYNSLFLPRSLTISNPSGSATNTYTYAADGRKLNAIIGGRSIDYCGNVIYESDALKRILVEGGYVEGGIYYFYLTDHLGNNCVVADTGGSVKQSNHYYPYGMSFGEGNQASSQPYRFGAKELDAERGLNLYDFGARWYDPVGTYFPIVDPLAEKYPASSPYAYCGNNPVNRIDPTGADWYKDEQGNLHWREGHQDLPGYSHLGASATIQLGKDIFFNAYQNAGVIANKAVNAFDLIASSGKLQNQFLGKDSPLSENSKSELFNALVNRDTNEIGLKVGQTMLTAEMIISGVGTLGTLGRLGASLFTKGADRVFWSGGTKVMNAAMDYAKSNGMTTLEMTRAGKNLTNLTTGMSWSEAGPMWQRLSTIYARGAKGSVHVFQNSRGIGINSIWSTIEYPILEQNGVNIIYHVVK